MIFERAQNVTESSDVPASYHLFFFIIFNFPGCLFSSPTKLCGNTLFRRRNNQQSYNTRFEICLIERQEHKKYKLYVH